MFSQKDIADYYCQTQIHYQIWWNLAETKSLHYGIWYPDTKNFKEALYNTNVELGNLAGISSTDLVLDAGCGVAGAAIYLAQSIGCHVKGITISEIQYKVSLKNVIKAQLTENIEVSIQDFTKTNYLDNTFDVVWACESSCHASPKSSFLREAYRILKPGGKLVVSDYFLTSEGSLDPNKYILKWRKTWAISEFNNPTNFTDEAIKTGFKLLHEIDFSKEILPSSRRMYLAYLLGWLPSNLYNLTHNTSRFAKTHFLSGKYQYLALKKKQWSYKMILLQKSQS